MPGKGDDIMASLRKRMRGNSPTFEIDFFANGQRKTIPLGAKYTKKTATDLKDVVETLLRYKDNGVVILDKRTSVWIESTTQEIRAKLAKAGLIELPPTYTLKELWDSFLKHKASELNTDKIKESTYDLYDYIGKRFFLFFEPDEPLDELDKDRAQHWKDHLLDEVAEATVACYIKETKACFNWAVNQKWIDKSPFDGVSVGSFVNKKKTRIIPRRIRASRKTKNCPPRRQRSLNVLRNGSTDVLLPSTSLWNLIRLAGTVAANEQIPIVVPVENEVFKTGRNGFFYLDLHSSVFSTSIVFPARVMVILID